MNSKTIFSLSEYQRATLSEMGISCWQQVETSADVSDTNYNTNKDETNSSQGSSKDGVPQRPESVEIQNSKQAKSIPEHVLLQITTTQSAHPIIKDVLNTLNIPLNALITVSNGEIEDYADYLMAWKIAPEAGLDGTILSTPDLSILSSPEAKKHLWKLLQSCHLFP
ncbi:MAG: hypothetical protein ACI808_000690 [Paraglaciecola sp.]|jgi:hypothetical protein